MLRRCAAPLLVLLSLALAVPALAQAAPTCQYILGFATLHSLDPGDVGDCVDNQAFAANGDAQQHTTKGLMAWRKADNWTAFTNGYWTWINGPYGLAKRLNTQRFSWEANPDALAVIDNAGKVVTAATNAPGASTDQALIGQSLSYTAIATTFRSVVVDAIFTPDIPANAAETGYAPPAGDQLLIAKITSANTGTAAEPLVLAAVFGLVGPDGTRYPSDIQASVIATMFFPGAPPVVSLLPGQTETDYLAFLVSSSPLALAPVDLELAPVAPAQPLPAPSVVTGSLPVTAICNDGTVSYSAHSSGTCSHHGGVQTWVNRPAS